MRITPLFTATLTVCLAMLLAPAAHVAFAADHGDGPNVAGDQNADLGDTYVFLDPNDNSKLILATTFRGFIVPGEAVNFVKMVYGAIPKKLFPARTVQPGAAGHP